MNLRNNLLFRVLLIVFVVVVHEARAYNLSGPRWRSSVVNMHLQLGSSGGTLIDGAQSWGASAEDALAIWNSNLTAVKFTIVQDSNVARSNGNGVNNVFFASSVYGSQWGNGVLAVTLSLYNSSTYLEADVLFNVNYSWNSYRGALKPDTNGTLLDFHRVAIHEFGHVLGLNHPDDIGQQVSSVMNARTSNVDSLSADDISGARAIYETASVVIQPSIITQPISQQVDIGASVNFSVVASGTSPFSYIWTKNGAQISGRTTASISFSNVQPVDAGSYACVVTNASGSSTSNIANLTIRNNSVAPAFTTQPSGQNANLGSTVTFTVAAVGSPTPTYQWFKNNVIMTGRTTPSLTITNIQTADGANYSCTASNSAGVSYSNVATLSVTGGNSGSISATITLPSGSAADLFALPPGTIKPSRGTESTLYGIAPKDNTEFVAVGANGIIIRYRKSEGWKAQKSPTVENLNAVIFSNNTYIAVGAFGQIVSSSDGINWTQRAVGLTNESLRSVAYNTALRLFVAVGDHGTSLSSSDGNAWFKRAIGDSSTSLNCITSTPTGFSAVGSTVLSGTRKGVLYSTTSGTSWSSPKTIAPGDGLAIYNDETLFALDIDGYPGSIQERNKQNIWVESDAKIEAQSINALTNTRFGQVGVGSGGIVTIRSIQTGVWSRQPDVSRDLYAVTDLPPEIGANPDHVPATWIAVGEDGIVAIGGIAPPVTSKLANLSIRSSAGAGDKTLIVGFVVANGSKSMLIRGIGPTLDQFGVAGALVDPFLSLYSGGRIIGSNDNWSNNPDTPVISAVSSALGAFALSAGSRDSALLRSPNNGAYSAQVTGISGTNGIALVELYDAEIAGPSRLLNASARTDVGIGSSILIAGFSIVGAGKKNLLIRGAGPALTSFGVGGALANPQLAVFSGTTMVASNDNWSDSGNVALIKSATKDVSAFPFVDGSRDSSLIVSLNPGNYTAQISGVGNTTGIALVEIYEIP